MKHLGRTRDSADIVSKGYADKYGEVITSIFLPSSSWVVSGKNFVQTGGVVGYAMTANTKADLQGSPAIISQLIDDGVNALTIANDNGILVITAIGAKPTADITVQVGLKEVTVL